MKATESISQVTCWHCEEPVHRYATRCPYCQKSLATSTPNEEAPPIPSSKITSLPRFEARAPVDEEEDSEPEVEESFGSQVGHVLLALFTLLAGSFFFFFGLLILLFSTNGTFSLEWKASSWPYFVSSAMGLLITGLWSLSKVEK